MLFADSSVQVANTSYLWIWVVIGVVSLITSVIIAARWLRNQGAEDARIEDRDKALEIRLASIERKLSPNGLDTEQVGDVVKRTENKVDALSSKLDQHIGEEKQARREMWRVINGKQDAQAAQSAAPGFGT